MAGNNALWGLGVGNQEHPLKEALCHTGTQTPPLLVKHRARLPLFRGFASKCTDDKAAVRLQSQNSLQERNSGYVVSCVVSYILGF